MVDKYSPEKRSWIMSHIKGKNTQPEMLVRRYLHSKGFRYRLFDKKLPCHPDIVLKKFKTIVFVHGCFWHGHSGCKIAHIPKSRTEYWKNKIGKNIERDKKCIRLLEEQGWNVIVIWECQLAKWKIGETLANLELEIRGHATTLRN